MVTIVEITWIAGTVESCFDAARSVEVHLKGNRRWGEQAVALEGVTAGLMELGDEVTWRARHFGVRQKLTSRITAIEKPAYFQDTMLRGAFRSMQHDHYFVAMAGGTEMKDVFRFAAPLPLLGRMAEILLLRRYMRALLRERNAVVKAAVEAKESF